MKPDNDKETKRKTKRNSDQLWDEMLKAIVERMPEQLLPLIEDVFQVRYNEGAKVKILPTSKIVPKRLPNRKLTSIHSDIAIQIETDYYHLESQLKNDKFMVIRMMQYDFHLALSNSVTEMSPYEFSLEFPKSAVIYLEPNSEIPDQHVCHIIFPDGSKHDYVVPTIKVFDYDFTEIQKKHLTIFIPFLLLKLRPRLKSKKNPLSSAELTDFVNQIILILATEKNEKRINQSQFEDYIELLDQAACRVFSNDELYRNQVINMTKSTIILPSERYERYEKKIAEKDAKLAEKDIIIEKITSENNAHLREKDAYLAEKDALIAELRAQIAEMKKNM